MVWMYVIKSGADDIDGVAASDDTRRQVQAGRKAYVRTQDSGNRRFEGYSRSKTVVHNAQSIVLSLEELLRDGTDLQQQRVTLHVECSKTMLSSCTTGYLRDMNYLLVMS